jgi:hypothetical protein
LREKGRRVGLGVFIIGVVLMVVSSLLPWVLHPLYIRYGWTKGFLEHVWPQTIVGNTPLVVLVWILSLPVGVVFAIIGGLIYARGGREGV